MFIPEFLYGYGKEVKKKCGKIVKELIEKKQWKEVVEKDMIESEGLNVVYTYHRLNPFMQNRKYIWLNLLLDEYMSTLKHRFDLIPITLFHDSLQKPWVLLMFLNEQFYIIERTSIIKLFLKQLFKYWNIINQEISIHGITEYGKKPINITFKASLKISLFQLGVPKEMLSNDRLEPHYLKELLEEYKISLDE